MVLPTINTMIEALQDVIVLCVSPQHSLDTLNFESGLTTSFLPVGVLLFVFRRSDRWSHEKWAINFTYVLLFSGFIRTNNVEVTAEERT